jgi:asparagine N-glycosylation enzyme membrane subunit Stt3
MLVIWKGWGILAPILYFGIAILIQKLVNSSYGYDFYATGVWPPLVSGVLSALPVWFIGKKLNTPKVGMAKNFKIHFFSSP